MSARRRRRRGSGGNGNGDGGERTPTEERTRVRNRNGRSDDATDGGGGRERDGGGGRDRDGGGGGDDGKGGKGGSQGGRRRRGRPRNDRKNRNRNRGRNRNQRPKGVGFWGDADRLPDFEGTVRITDDPSAVPRSLGPPPLPGHEAIAQHYFTAVYDRAVATAGALAAAGGLIDPTALTEHDGED